MMIVNRKVITHSSDIEVAITLEALAMIHAEQMEAAQASNEADERMHAVFVEYHKTGKVAEWDKAIAELE